MRLRIRPWFNSQLVRFLGQFSEVRELRKLRREYETRVRGIYAKELEHRKAAEHAAIEQAKAERELRDTERALEVMTEARMNADRAVEVIRGQMDTLREVSEREIQSIKQTVDFFALDVRGRQVFGTAPLVTKPREAESEQAVGSLRARQFIQRQAAENLQGARADLERLMAEAQERYSKTGSVPTAGPEYSSTSHAVQEQPVA